MPRRSSETFNLCLIGGGPNALYMLERVLARAKNIKLGNPLDTDTMVGAQVSLEQFERIMGYMDVARNEGAHFLMGGAKATVGSDIFGSTLPRNTTAIITSPPESHSHARR